VGPINLADVRNYFFDATILALGSVGLMLASLASLLFFLLGAACSAICINWGRKRQLHGEYALPLMLEAGLLLLFGLLGGQSGNAQMAICTHRGIAVVFHHGLAKCHHYQNLQAEIVHHMTGMVPYRHRTWQDVLLEQ